MALAVAAVALSIEAGASLTVTEAAGRFLVLGNFVWRFEPKGRFGILREKLGVAARTTALLPLNVGAVIEGNIPVLRRENQLLRRRLGLRQERRQAKHRNGKKE